MTKDEALKLALEALTYIYTETTADEDELIDKAINAIKEALAQPEQEPVAWMVYTLDGRSVCVTDNPADFTPEHRALPLYTAPPQPSAIARKPLTDKQLNIIGSRWHLNLLCADEKAELFAFARAIEAAHGIKGDA